MHRNRDRNRFDRHKRIDMVLVVRLKQNDLVAGIQQSRTGGMESPRCTGTDGDVGFRVNLHPVVPFQLLGNRLPQLRQPVESCIDVIAITNRLLSPFEHHRRNRRITDPLRHIETLCTGTGLSHSTNLRLSQVRHPSTDCTHYTAPSLLPTTGILSGRGLCQRHDRMTNSGPPRGRRLQRSRMNRVFTSSRCIRQNRVTCYREV